MALRDDDSSKNKSRPSNTKKPNGEILSKFISAFEAEEEEEEMNGLSKYFMGFMDDFVQFCSFVLLLSLEYLSFVCFFVCSTFSSVTY